jgi:hypothetical protein
MYANYLGLMVRGSAGAFKLMKRWYGKKDLLGTYRSLDALEQRIERYGELTTRGKRSYRRRGRTWARVLAFLQLTDNRRAVPSAASSAGCITIKRIGLVRQVMYGLAHDRNDLLHDITADAVGSTLDEIADRRAEGHLRIFVAGEIPIVFF